VDPEDAEIRMINEGPLRLSMPDSGLQDEDNMSDTSVQNTQVRLLSSRITSFFFFSFYFTSNTT
jgi:hypothetical protein